MGYILGFRMVELIQALYTDLSHSKQVATAIFAKGLVREKRSSIIDYIACTSASASTSDNVR